MNGDRACGMFATQSIDKCVSINKWPKWLEISWIIFSRNGLSHPRMDDARNAWLQLMVTLVSYSDDVDIGFTKNAVTSTSIGQLKTYILRPFSVIIGTIVCTHQPHNIYICILCVLVSSNCKCDVFLHRNPDS